MAATLPDKVIKWISETLSLEEFRVAEIKRHGSHALKVTELKTVSYEIDKLLSIYCLNNTTTKEQLAVFQDRFHRPSSNSKKDAWVNYIQKCFFKDRLLGIIVGKDDVIWKALNLVSIEEGNSKDSDGDKEETDKTGMDTHNIEDVEGYTEPPTKKMKIASSASSGQINQIPSALIPGINGFSDAPTAPGTSTLPSQFESMNHHLYATATPSYHVSMLPYPHHHHIVVPPTQACTTLHLMPPPGLALYQRSNDYMFPPQPIMQASLLQHAQASLISQQRLLNQSSATTILHPPPNYTASLLNNYSTPAGPLMNLPPMYPNLHTNAQSNQYNAAAAVEGGSQTQASPPKSQNYPSKLAALAAHKIQIKKESGIANTSKHAKETTTSGTMPSNVQDEVELLPKTPQDHYILSQLQLMGFADVREIMIALRAVQRTSGGEVNNNAFVLEETMVHIVTQREEQNEARKMDEARKQSEAASAAELEQNKQTTVSNRIMKTATIEEVIGFEDDGKSGNSSVHFLTSSLLTSTHVKKTFRAMMLFDLSNISRKRIMHLLTLEKKAIKWFGKKIPYAYFGIELPKSISEWSKGKFSQEHVFFLSKKIENEIEVIEHSMYTLSEQEKGDLGLMLPKMFVKARQKATTKGLIKDHRENDVIVLDDESVDPDGLGPEFLR